LTGEVSKNSEERKAIESLQSESNSSRKNEGTGQLHEDWRKSKAEISVNKARKESEEIFDSLTKRILKQNTPQRSGTTISSNKL